MIVVSDTTPLISLLKVDRLDLLEKLFHTVHIPQGVFNKLSAKPEFTDDAEKIRSCGFIHIHNVDSRAVNLLRKATRLDLGESEAIVLADTIDADLTLLDDAKARRVAILEGMIITGTVGILGKAYRENCITADEIRRCVEILRSSNRYISNELLNSLIKQL